MSKARMSQSPDGDFFDPEAAILLILIMGSLSQSPDGDFFDPEIHRGYDHRGRRLCHSPLTGIFLIRSQSRAGIQSSICAGHSPLTGIFLIRSGHASRRRRRDRLVTVP